ncbi:Uncharacterized protein HZ326_15613 [Fusarium oxysporum f. sp. albedinis]|nr:Uncharacterized protein HZ326_15613 [Fusarium oxysporum f. sp. albedinis]
MIQLLITTFGMRTLLLGRLQRPEWTQNSGSFIINQNGTNTKLSLLTLKPATQCSASKFMPCDQNTSAAKVLRLKRIFKTEGCNRSEPSNFILGTIPASLLSEALRLSELTLDNLQDSEGLRMLYLPPFQYIKCANGRSRAAALLDTPHLGTWWTVELYVDLDPKAFDIITENYINEGAFSHGHICERIVHHRSHNLTEEKRWWARLTNSLGVILRSILKHPSIAPALLELIINIPGMREGFEIGTWHKIIGGKCDEVYIVCHM